MLFELVNDYTKLRPVEFHTFSKIARTEKHLEDLLARHLFEVLFQRTPLLPFHQERQYEAAADIYALNQKGDVVIFELKRDQAEPGALDQLLRYAGEAGLWGYNEIERKYLKYPDADHTLSLKQAHMRTFNLEPGLELHENQFNRQQHLWVVGSAAADHLIRSVDYWKSKGLSIDFFPYRVYQFDGKAYIEFFAKPYDQHINPALRKGVLFDTNKSWDYEKEVGGYGCLRDMLTKKRISAYGERKEAVLCLEKEDYVFYSHVGKGIVGAAKVKGRNVQKIRHPKYMDEWFWDVDILTPIPSDFTNIAAMSFNQATRLLGKGFFWARIDKRPYLSIEESKQLVDELKKILIPKAGETEVILTEQRVVP
jgi:hypothetical protein